MSDINTKLYKLSYTYALAAANNFEIKGASTTFIANNMYPSRSESRDAMAKIPVSAAPLKAPRARI